MKHELLKRQQEALFQIESIPVDRKKRSFSVSCSLGPGNMSAFVKVIAVEKDCGVTEFDIVRKLYEKNIYIGIDYEEIEKIVADNIINTDVLVAMGFSPEDGVDAEIVPQIELEEFTTAEDIKNFPGQRIRAGIPIDLDQPLFIKQAATPGKIGMTVIGRKIEPNPGKDVEFAKGENVAVSPDGLSLAATMPGLAGLSKGKPSVRDEDYDEWKFKIQFRKNNMEAVLIITPGLGNQPEIDEQFLNSLYEKHDIKFGVDSTIARRIPARIKSTLVITVANGEPPTFPSNAEIEEAFRESGGPLYPVVKGQTIVVKRPALPGAKGRNVLDEPILPPKGTDIDIPAGTNTSLSENGLELVSNIDGFVSMEKNSYCVVECKEYDPSAGMIPVKIDFPGMIRILGNVSEARTIIAGHHIEILGDVKSAEVVSGGSLVIHGKVTDCVKSKIQSTSDMHIGSAARSRLLCGGDIRIGGTAEFCDIILNGSLMGRNGDKCDIIGGRVVAAGNVATGNIGASKPSPTSIEVGAPLPLRSRHDHTARQTVVMIKNKKIVESELNRLIPIAKSGKISSDEMAKLKRASVIHEALSQRIERNSAGLRKLQFVMAKLSARANVKAVSAVFPETTIKIGRLAMKIDRRLDKVAFKLNEQQDAVISSKI